VAVSGSASLTGELFALFVSYSTDTERRAGLSAIAESLVIADG